MHTLVGLEVGREGGPALTPSGGRVSAADRLRLLLGMTQVEFTQAFPRRYNVRETRGLQYRLTGLVVVLGKQAWRELGLKSASFFTRHHTERAVWLLLPHPSGRNRLLNDWRARRRMRQCLRLMCPPTLS